MRVSSVAVAALRLIPLRTARNICRHVPLRHDIEIGGVKVRCHLNDNVTERELAIDPQFGAGLLGPLGELLAEVGEGDTVVDVGANCGVYSLLAARRVGPSGRVIAIEPLPSMGARIRFNAEQNNLSNIEIVDCAIGASAGTATLHVRHANYGQSSMLPSPGFEAITVPVKPLAEILAAKGVDKVAALKIDVEGFEDQALVPFLQSAQQTLWPRRILIEIAHRSRWREDLVASMLQSGYREIWTDGYDALFSLA